MWRVEEIEPDRLLRLRAEMLLPGRAWLEMSEAGRTGQRATASGPCSCRAGWPGTPTGRPSLPFHGMIFGGMARNITRAAERDADA